MKNLLAIVLLVLSAGSLWGQVERGPVTIIEETTTHLLNTLSDRRDEFESDPALLRQLVNDDILPLIDLEYSARLILGRAGRGVEDEQLMEFANAMSEILLGRYAEGLLGFNSEEQVQVLPMKGKNTDKLTRVRTRLKLENGGSVPIDYAFRKTDDGWKAFDVTVEGISYVLTFRNQIAPRVQSDGIEKVTADIRAGNISLEG
jgi:phospholipid transport system substrate-binding protein